MSHRGYDILYDDDLIMEKLGLEHSIGLLDHSEADAFFFQYADLIRGMVFGWSYIFYESTKEVLEDMILAGFQNQSISDLDILINLVCVR